MIKKIIFLIYINTIMVLPLVLFAKGEGTTAGSFLKIDIGARPVGMGGVFVGIADDVNAIQYNPAGLLQITQKELSVTHNEWIEGIKSEFLGYVHPINDMWALGITLNYLYVSELVERDIYGNESGRTFGSNDGLLTFSVARKISNNVLAGVNFKIIQESIKDRNDKAYYFDFGLLFKFSKLATGIVIQNLGTKIKLYEESFSLPLNLKLGLSYNLFKDMKLGLDVNKPLDNEFDLRVGGEYWIYDIFALRTGYKFNQDKNTGSGISAGFGLRYKDYQVDYSNFAFGDFGTTHEISFNVKF